MLEPQSLYVEMSMANSMTLQNFLKLVGLFPTQTICFWGIMLIGAITHSRLFAYFSRSKSDINKD